MRAALAEAKAACVTHMAFGDLFLADPFRGNESVNDSPRGRPRVTDGEGTSRRLR
jgi:hypothetical protein